MNTRRVLGLLAAVLITIGQTLIFTVETAGTEALQASATGLVQRADGPASA